MKASNFCGAIFHDDWHDWKVIFGQDNFFLETRFLCEVLAYWLFDRIKANNRLYLFKFFLFHIIFCVCSIICIFCISYFEVPYWVINKWWLFSSCRWNFLTATRYSLSLLSYLKVWLNIRVNCNLVP